MTTENTLKTTKIPTKFTQEAIEEDVLKEIDANLKEYFEILIEWNQVHKNI